MRPTTAFILFSIGALGVLTYIGKEVGVKAPALPDLKMPDIELSDAMKSLSQQTGQNDGKDVTAYKWQDSNGQWHYGGTPPEGANAIPVTVNTNQNVVPGFASKAEHSEDTKEEQEEKAGLDPASALPASYQEAAKMLGIKLPTPRQDSESKKETP